MTDHRQSRRAGNVGNSAHTTPGSIFDYDAMPAQLRFALRNANMNWNPTQVLALFIRDGLDAALVAIERADEREAISHAFILESGERFPNEHHGGN